MALFKVHDVWSKSITCSFRSSSWVIANIIELSICNVLTAHLSRESIDLIIAIFSGEASETLGADNTHRCATMLSLFRSTTTYDPVFALLNAETEEHRDKLTEKWRDHKLEELNFIGIVVSGYFLNCLTGHESLRTNASLRCFRSFHGFALTCAQFTIHLMRLK